MSEKKPKLQLITRGCSKNRVDSEHILAQVSDSYEICPEEGLELSYVDTVVVNTCGFIGDAKEESINTILEVVKRKRDSLVGRIVVFGCLSQRYASELPELIPEVDLWLGARDNDGIVKALGVVPDVRRNRSRYISGSSYAFLKISEGCDRRCSYCAIPFIRGAHRSVPMEELVEEARNLAAKGVRELVIIAQDTTYYGLDLYRRRCLGELLQRLSEVEGIEWLRLHYSYPADFPEDVLDIMATNPKVCRYLDIPLQHISDKVLDNMHRHVDGRWTRELISRMREKVPGVVLRTTMIVGHPGEGTREFDELLDFVRDARFERLGAFAYSEEEGTWGAEHLRDSVRPSTKRRRLERLMELQRGISSDFNLSRIGRQEKVLVDSWFADEGVLVCRSEFESPEVDGEILVKYDADLFGNAAPETLVGKFVFVKLVAADDYDIAADFVSPAEPYTAI
ncbi:MAG: 30S ribosomal protein S12 methylthiotransferase RimO [Candidatus Cryptobacteroides sp.]